MRSITTLARYDAPTVLRAFGGGQGETIALDRADFVSVMGDFLTPECRTDARSVRAGAALFEQLFNLFDADHNGVVSAAELGAGLSVLCGGR